MDILTLKVANITSKISAALPASKSISNRLLVINALAGNSIRIRNLSDANDTAVLNTILTAGYPQNQPEIEINCHDAGTVMRFLTAYFAITPGRWLLKGTERMHRRPVKILVDALRELGADIEYKGNEGYPPLLVTGKTLQGGKITMDATVSSQYISALMMIAPRLENGLEIHLEGKIASQPYIAMTAGLMHQCGATVELNEKTITIPKGNYTATEITVERDWSAASYWYAIAATTKHEIELKGLHKNSLQGDSIVAQWMQPLGIHTAYSNHGAVLTPTGNITSFFEQDFTNNPDLAPAFIALCGALGIPGRFYGLESLAIKESDRTAALAAELAKAGIQFMQNDNHWQLLPNPHLHQPDSLPVFETHNDHRIAMALSVFAFVLPQIQIKNPGVVKKSYPGFWEDLKTVCVVK